jgi:hypothetical protein
MSTADLDQGTPTAQEVADRIAAEWEEIDRPMNEAWQITSDEAPKADPPKPKDPRGGELLSEIEQGLTTLVEIEEQRSRSEQERERDEALDNALARYDEGFDAAAIADELLRLHGPETAQEFVGIWREEEAPEPEPTTPEQWIRRFQSVSALQRETERMQAEAAAYEAAEKHRAEQAAAITAEWSRLRRDVPNFDRFAGDVAELASPVVSQAGSPEEARELLALAASSAAELDRARRAAAIKTDMDADYHRENAGYEGGPLEFDREAAFERNLRAELNLNAIDLPGSREQEVAEIRASLDPTERERSVDEGFAALDRAVFTPEQRGKKRR